MSEQLGVSDRQGYLGGSDAAVILGVSPWRSRLQLCAEKKGVTSLTLTPEKEALFYFGNLMEEPIGLAVERFYGIKLKRAVNKDGTQRFFRSKKYPFMGGHIDWFEDRAQPSFFLECKNVRFASDGWGAMRDSPLEEDASELVPPYYLAQCRHYLAMLEMKYCYLAALFGGCELRIYRIDRNDDAERILVTAERDFWDRYVVGNDLPEARTAEDYSAALSITKQLGAKREVTCDQHMALRLKRLAEIRKTTKALDEEASLIRDSLIVLASGGAAVFIDEAGNKLGHLNASVRKSPDIDAFKSEYPEAYELYSQCIKTNAYYIVRTV